MREKKMTRQVTAKSNPRDIIQHTVAEVISEQPWYQRRKDSITQVAGFALQLAQIWLLSYHDSPVWIIVALGIIIAIAQTAIIAGTKGAVTPSMVERLAEKADRIPTTSVSEKVSSDYSNYEEALKERYGGGGNEKNPTE